MTKRRFLTAVAAFALSSCCGNDVYDFQPENKERSSCGVVTYNDPTTAEEEDDVPIGRFCPTESGKR